MGISSVELRVSDRGEDMDDANTCNALVGW